MELEPIHKSAIGLDVHQKHVTACLIAEQEDGSIHTETPTFGTFKRDRRALARWARDANPEIVVMESTGIYWKSIYSALEREGIVAAVVNARHVKQVPGRKNGCGRQSPAGPLRPASRELLSSRRTGKPPSDFP